VEQSDATITATDPRAFIWWNGVPICRRPARPQRPSRPTQDAVCVRLTPEQIERYAVLLLADKERRVR
jgi:hypothetical protein